IEAEQKVTQARAEEETLRFQKRKCDPRLVSLGQIEAGLRGSRSGTAACRRSRHRRPVRRREEP
ncbi:MAG TPA: hypothetical protein VLD40_06610, partial [Dissulfurispiraceae bacterium]|nr:hypothetical protein [Dissulfurispiraceae bacterium]